MYNPFQAVLPIPFGTALTRFSMQVLCCVVTYFIKVTGNLVYTSGYSSEHFDTVRPDIAVSGRIDLLHVWEQALPDSEKYIYCDGRKYELWYLFKIKQDNRNKCDVAAAEGDHGFMVVYQNRST